MERGYAESQNTAGLTAFRWCPLRFLITRDHVFLNKHDSIHGESQISYKCTDFCDDEVLFSGTAHGGRTELSSDKAPSALMAVTVAEELGIFGIKPSKAMDMLTGKRVSLGLSIDAYDRVVRGPFC